MEETVELCSLLDWDSQHWGFPVARINGHTLAEKTAQEVTRWCSDQKVRCLYFAADGSCAETLQQASNSGFRFVDMRVDMEKKLLPGAPQTADDTTCRAAVQEDLAAMVQLARVAHEDARFFKDADFDRARAADLYALWIARDFLENQVFVASSAKGNGELSGYVSASASAANGGRIGLVAVRSEARGRGLGRCLVDRASSWCQSRGVGSVRVATQGTNVPALRLYESCGFRTADVKVWFHRWFDE